jgi:excinuclease UvrABC ATPase subunit
MNYTCPNCNGMGIVNYDSDLPRFKQQLALCARARALYAETERVWETIQEETQEAETEDQQSDFYEPLRMVGLEERDFAMYIQSLEREVNEEIFTIRMLEGEQDPKEENPHFYCLIVFENREIMKSKVSTFEHEDKIAIRTQGKWL